ncbi:hypothetical protein VR010_00605 [Actinomycetaceae bacterium L2_0104]
MNFENMKCVMQWRPQTVVFGRTDAGQPYTMPNRQDDIRGGTRRCIPAPAQPDEPAVRQGGVDLLLGKTKLVQSVEVEHAILEHGETSTRAAMIFSAGTTVVDGSRTKARWGNIDDAAYVGITAFSVPWTAYGTL